VNSHYHNNIPLQFGRQAAMTSPVATYEGLGDEITRIDSGMIRPGLAALYLMGSEGEYALVETGTHHSIPNVMTLLSKQAINPEQVKYIIPTHVHLDHAGGVGGLMELLPSATLLVHPKGARHMIEPAKLKAGATAVYGEQAFAEIYGDVIAVDSDRVQEMQDTDQVVLGARTLVFYDTPGHARHHFCVHDLLSNGIFTGDTFGLAYPDLTTSQGPFIIPTTTPVQFDPAELKNSIARLLALRPDKMYLTHYGVVAQPQQLAPVLLQQIDDYVALAEKARAQVPPAEWEECLRQWLTDYTWQRAREHGCTQTDDELQVALGMDLRLNAQGLTVWLQHH
jgi:glyoxylase-like metal-dependent hydrolase (beta-lactamase superfamily II)